MLEKEAEKAIREINEQVENGYIKKLDNSNFQADDPFDQLVFGYFKYATANIDDEEVIKNHWNYFKKGWESVPYLMAVFENNQNSSEDRIQMLKYLELFVTPAALRDQVFSPEELIFLTEKHQTPLFLAKLIAESIIFVNLEEIETIVGQEAAAIQKRSEELLNKNISGSKNFNYEPADNFEGYELPDSF